MRQTSGETGSQFTPPGGAGGDKSPSPGDVRAPDNSSPSEASLTAENTAPVTDAQRSGSLTGMGIVLGFSLTFVWSFSTGPGKWTLSWGLVALGILVAGIGSQLAALFTALT